LRLHQPTGGKFCFRRDAGCIKDKNFDSGHPVLCGLLDGSWREAALR
jgi:hypothetical protein